MATKSNPKVKTTKSEVKTVEDLTKELQTKRQDLIEAKRSLAARELVNPRVVTATRKEIARLLTAIRAAESATKETK